jgi:hypothetical protein
MVIVNIITYQNNSGLSNDVEILKKILQNQQYEINVIDYYKYECPLADINIFLEVLNPILFHFSKINILIPNQEWFYKTWIPYLPYLDYILVKTKYCESIFQKYVDHSKITYISWTSIDRYNVNIEKDYSKCLHLCGKSRHRNTQLLIDSWSSKDPMLTVVYSPVDIKLVHKRQSNITYMDRRCSEGELNKMMNSHGIHLCTSSTEGFGHYINEAKSSKGVVFTLDHSPMNELIDNTCGVLIKTKKIKQMTEVLGEKCDFYMGNLQKKLKKTYDYESVGNIARQQYLTGSKWFENTLITKIVGIVDNISKTKHSMMGSLAMCLQKNNKIMDSLGLSDNFSSLPKISIITLTHNRKNFFKLAIQNYIYDTYPKDKVEWIILDDSVDEHKVKSLFTKNLLDNYDIKYTSYNKKIKLGKKRNIGVEKASGEIIVFMDDDDLYYPTSILHRIFALLLSKKKCVYCSTIGCFQINKYISMINVPPFKDPYCKRVSEASMTFYKSFWKDKQFSNESIGAEGEHFIKDRYHECLELSWKHIFISLMHSKNTSTKITMGDEPNGCHYKLNDKLFEFITSLDIYV